MTSKEEPKKDVEMKDSEGEEKKRSIEDRLRMSMTSMASTRGEEDKEEEISATEAHALLVSRECFSPSLSSSPSTHAKFHEIRTQVEYWLV